MKPSSSLCQFALLPLGPGALMLNLKHPKHRFDAPGAFGPTRVVMWATIAVESSFISLSLKLKRCVLIQHCSNATRDIMAIGS